MVVKKPIQCGECKKYIDVYIEDKKSLKGVTITCKCGSKQLCIEDKGAISKWRSIE